jgi:hypothetical protein
MRKPTRQALPHSYTKAEIHFIERTVPGRSYEETRQLFNERFGTSLTFGQIQRVLHRLGLKNGRVMRFGPDRPSPSKGKKGIIPPGFQKWRESGGKNSNERPVGDEIINYFGHIMVKTTKGWKPRRVVIWEETYGPIPEGHVIILVNGNKSDMSLDNMFMVSKRELAMMNRFGLIYPEKDLLKAGKSIANLILMIKERKRQMQKIGGETVTGEQGVS